MGNRHRGGGVGEQPGDLSHQQLATQQRFVLHPTGGERSCLGRIDQCLAQPLLSLGVEPGELKLEQQVFELSYVHIDVPGPGAHAPCFAMPRSMHCSSLRRNRNNTDLAPSTERLVTVAICSIE